MSTPQLKSDHKTLKQRLGRFFIPRLPVNRRVFDVFRFELNAMMLRLANKLSPWRRIRIRDLRAMKHVSVNCGSGGSCDREDWINLDIANGPGVTLPWDIRAGLPFRSGQVERVFAEHVLEHLDFREEAPFVLKEFFRVLEPGSWVRIVVPDCERFITAYVLKDQDMWDSLGFPNLPPDMTLQMELINHVFHQGGEHYFGYDFDTMHDVLVKAGFSKICKMEYGKSNDQKLCIDGEVHRAYSLYVEARK